MGVGQGHVWAGIALVRVVTAAQDVAVVRNVLGVLHVMNACWETLARVEGDLDHLGDGGYPWKALAHLLRVSAALRLLHLAPEPRPMVVSVRGLRVGLFAVRAAGSALAAPRCRWDSLLLPATQGRAVSTFASPSKEDCDLFGVTAPE